MQQKHEIKGRNFNSQNILHCSDLPGLCRPCGKSQICTTREESWNMKFGVYLGWLACLTIPRPSPQRKNFALGHKQILSAKRERGCHSTTLQCKQMALGRYILFLSLGLLFSHLWTASCRTLVKSRWVFSVVLMQLFWCFKLLWSKKKL